MDEVVEVPPEPGEEDVAMLMGTVPERVADLVMGLDEPRLRYRHGPAFPSLTEVVSHLCDAGTGVDVLLRHAYLDKQRDLRLRATIDPQPPLQPDLGPSLDEQLHNFGRVRRRTVDLLRGLTEYDWAATITDPEQGDLTLLEVCRQVTRHELGHVVQIRNLIAVLPEA